ncbi:hypothetical protein [Nonomuraea pusilla]|uniref:Excreted virulence factor EspC, type VII ESX diderm n=1 Tax=Nonomuraea pusilla TaxID=46177 RepID=A0A1H7V9A2_9ACTN|nr:hypothetical protein [Nonomuraea pusilla]SEM05569.1 hypothetical protein SAMN05660976_04040 [Nonomuraea pusilla]
MGSNREIHITSKTISRTQDRLQEELRDGLISFVKGLVPTTAVGGLGFGVLGGMILGGAYEGIQQRAEQLLGEAEGAVDSWVHSLGVCQRNWRAAEDAGIVRYKA